MCGIAGIIDPQQSPRERAAAVQGMCQAMLHRGPDDGGIAESGPATLGMRRLAIFDPANGHQPMLSPDGRYTLIFNGAIYNHRDLRAELAGTFWTFRTHCDTEVLLAAFARWGAHCLSRLRGMYAFAVWDREEQALFLARDTFGIKPLYYRQDGASFLFASEINALLASGLVDATIEPTAVADYLAWLAVPAPRTIYQGIFSLLPGTSARFVQGKLQTETAWNFRTIPVDPHPCTSRPQFIEELRSRLEDTVRAHVVADVPVGAFLSGGLDSSSVVGLMTHVGASRLRTFSIDFCEAGFSEAAAAAANARHFGSDHHTLELTGADVARDIEKLLGGLDQPTGDGVNTYYASQAARRGGVTVALSGLGGDELFGGYPSFRDTPRLASWLPAWRRVPSRARAAVIARLRRGNTRYRKIADVLDHARNLQETGAMQRRLYAAPSIEALLTPHTSSTRAARSPFHPSLDLLRPELDEEHAFELVSAWELSTYMTDVLLRDSDVMSMRHSLELRVPLVDRPLIEWLWRQPARFKSDPRHPKSALRDALADLLPPGLAGRKKWGFTPPFTVWMKRDLRPFLDEVFSPASIRRSGLFQPGAASAAWQQFVSGDDPREWSRVWSLAVMIAFANRPTISRTATPETPVGITLAGITAATANLAAFPRAESPLTEARLPTDDELPGLHPIAVDEPPERSGRDSLPPPPSTTLLLAPEVYSTEGGIARILRSYLRALCELAAPAGAVHLLALNDPALSAADLRQHSNLRLLSSVACGRDKVRFTREALRLSRHCDQIICGHVFMLPVAWLARQLNPRLKYYLIAHGIEVWRPFSLPERIALRGAENILCVSNYTRQQLLAHCPLPERRAVVVPNVLDARFPIATGRPLAECEPIILVVSRLTWDDRYKGVEHMIAAMPAICASLPAARLRIVGRGNDLPRLQETARQLGVSGSIEFTGYVDDARLAEEFRTCRLFALPSRKEGFGLVYLEAMAQGRPCLAARAGGAPEVLTPEVGDLVEFGDVPAIARTAVASLQRNWDEATILSRARAFAYPTLRNNLAAALSARRSTLSGPASSL